MLWDMILDLLTFKINFMKKNILYTITLLLLISSCHDVRVGYLITDNAEYSIDSLIITSYNALISRYEKSNDEFVKKVSKDSIDAFDKLHEKLLILEVEKNRLSDIYYEKSDAYNDYINSGGSDPAVISDLKNQMQEAEDKYESYRRNLYEPVYDRIYDLNTLFRMCAENMGREYSNIFRSYWDFMSGYSTPHFLTKYIESIKKLKQENIPWTTSTIEGILGTQPLMYEILDVKGENKEGSDEFRKALSVMGGGRLIVEGNVDVPLGRYVVSLVVRNEGYRNEIKNAFTFIISDK